MLEKIVESRQFVAICLETISQANILSSLKNLGWQT